ncbi:STAS domain-containing protein [Rhodococcus aetherivorans]|uniref:STAS domain-containing protein n=1 Tax=Rhodococcus aetherivorans TaxID=191292 RepID=UPI00294A3472|nr:STAS domain-containing protein [Rhodococcus aetherivorans]MDV6296375.1 STAS domain-containing protein [Rhodococcus aetherivorans]
MVYLRSILDSPHRYSSSLLDTALFDDFSGDGTRVCIDVDEPPGGPVVVQVSGNVDEAAAPVLHSFLREAVVRGRGVVLDLLQVTAVECDTAALLERAESLLRERGANITVAGGAAVRRAVRDAGFEDRIACFDTFGPAFEAAHRGCDLRTAARRVQP